MPNNTYKAVRIKGKGDSYDWYYSVWCNNEHELYNLQVSSHLSHLVFFFSSFLFGLSLCKLTGWETKDDPHQMHNLYPGSNKNAVDTKDMSHDESALASVIHRLDSLTMVMKSCKGETCTKPWKVLHPEGDVDSLDDALNPRFDRFYRQQIRVSYSQCEPGYIIAAEGPQVGYEYREGLSWSHWT